MPCSKTSSQCLGENKLRGALSTHEIGDPIWNVAGPKQDLQLLVLPGATERKRNRSGGLLRPMLRFADGRDHAVRLDPRRADQTVVLMMKQHDMVIRICSPPAHHRSRSLSIKAPTWFCAWLKLRNNGTEGTLFRQGAYRARSSCMPGNKRRHRFRGALRRDEPAGAVACEFRIALSGLPFHARNRLRRRLSAGRDVAARMSDRGCCDAALSAPHTRLSAGGRGSELRPRGFSF